MQLVLQPCGDSDAREHYVDTIQNPVPVSRILPHLRSDERALVQDAFPDVVAVWGVTPGKNEVNANKWRRITVGDAAMLYRDRQFFFRGTVAYKTHSPELAKELWESRADGATWEYVFFLTDLEPVEISIDRFNAAAGYKETFIVQGFNVLSPEHSERILEELGLDSGIGATLPSDADIEAAKAALQAMDGELDADTSARRRKEQTHLRTILLGKKQTECCSICGRTLPVDLLVIGHIRKRHSCPQDIKKDLANVMPVCLLGCDVLFENGYIYVDTDGNIQAAAHVSKVPELQLAAKMVVGLKCRAWRTDSEPYFAWHRQHPRKFA
jgi:hypothetical protein